MGPATRRLVNQWRYARRADRMAKRICRRLRSGVEAGSVLAHVEFLRSGRDLVWEEIDGPSVYATSIGGHTDESKIVERRAVAPRDLLGFHIEEFEDKMTRKRWKVVEDLGVAQLRKAIEKRMLGLLEHVGSDVDALTSEERDPLLSQHVRFAVWLGDRDVRCWIDLDSPYVHVLMRVACGGIVTAEKKAAAA